MSRHRLHVDIAIHVALHCNPTQLHNYICETVLPGKIKVLHIDRKLFIVIVHTSVTSVSCFKPVQVLLSLFGGFLLPSLSLSFTPGMKP